jgi:hypothetical protein
MPGHSSTVIPFDSDLLTNTDWKSSSDPIIGALFPNFFIVYFGQDFPKGEISSDNIKVNFAKLGAGTASGSLQQLKPSKKSKTSMKFLTQRLSKPATSKQTLSRHTSFPSTTHLKHYPLSPDHTALSPSLIQTSSQSRQMSYVDSLSQLRLRPLQSLRSRT